VRGDGLDLGFVLDLGGEANIRHGIPGYFSCPRGSTS
jgi:hypothetical protein